MLVKVLLVQKEAKARIKINQFILCLMHSIFSPTDFIQIKGYRTQKFVTLDDLISK